jgi:hypothetical protein
MYGKRIEKGERENLLDDDGDELTGRKVHML